MELSTQWIGAADYGHKAKDGELLVCAVGPTSYLCLKASSPEESYALVLAEFGTETGDRIPRLVLSGALIDGHVIQRLSGGGFVIEALGDNASELFKPKVGLQISDGCLAILADGRKALRVSAGRSLGYVELSGGRLLGTIADPQVWLHSWRLLWVIGDDEQMELCRFPAEQPVS